MATSVIAAITAATAIAAGTRTRSATRSTAAAPRRSPPAGRLVMPPSMAATAGCDLRGLALAVAAGASSGQPSAVRPARRSGLRSDRLRAIRGGLGLLVALADVV